MFFWGDGSITYRTSLSTTENVSLYFPQVTKIDLGFCVIEYFKMRTYGELYEGMYFENYSMSQNNYDNIISVGIANTENIEANYLIYPIPNTTVVRAISNKIANFDCYVIYKK